jgi:hypothetical protein
MFRRDRNDVCRGAAARASRAHAADDREGVRFAAAAGKDDFARARAASSASCAARPSAWIELGLKPTLAR